MTGLTSKVRSLPAKVVRASDLPPGNKVAAHLSWSAVSSLGGALSLIRPRDNPKMNLKAILEETGKLSHAAPAFILNMWPGAGGKKVVRGPLLSLCVLEIEDPRLLEMLPTYVHTRTLLRRVQA